MVENKFAQLKMNWPNLVQARNLIKNPKLCMCVRMLLRDTLNVQTTKV